MEKIFDWGTPFVNAASGMLQGFLTYLPQLVGAILLLLVGWLVARLVRAITVRLMKGIDRFSGLIRLGDTGTGKLVSESAALITGNVVFWIVVLIFVTSATNLLGMTMFTGWLDKLVAHLPNIVSGILIICAGVVFGNLANQAVSTAASSMQARQRAILARSAQFFTLIILILIGVDQIGIDITVVITILSVAIGALLGGLAIAFSLGARPLVSNLIGARYLNADYRVGERIQIGAYEGTVLEISSVAVILDTEKGRVTIPAQAFSEEPSILLTRENANV
ncbi:MAG: mechanosensitive ion channel [Proteobacteria bacterium]|nr:mechanosensitive ion channel [Pseudomonadota bacterium]